VAAHRFPLVIGGVRRISLHTLANRRDAGTAEYFAATINSASAITVDADVLVGAA
jgi:hypothetical protein